MFCKALSKKLRCFFTGVLAFCGYHAIFTKRECFYPTGDVMMNSYIFFPLLTIAAVLISGCSQISHDVPRPESYDAAPVSKSAPFLRKKSKTAAAANRIFEAEANRQMAYTASFTLTVKDTADAAAFIKMQAQKSGGYVVSSNQFSVTAKIPVGKADEFVKMLSNSGKLSDFAMNAEDLTDTITDLNVRLDNLKKLRTRLTALLDQAQRVEDILKVEKELNRITTEIERLTAQLQNNQNKVALVTFTINLNTHTPAARDRNGVLRYYPFLQTSLCSTAAGDESEPLFDTVLPADFINAPGGKCGVYTAAAADDCFLVMQQQDIPDDSSLDFWGGMIRRALQTYHNFSEVKVEKCVWDGNDALLLTAEKTTVSGEISYMLLITIDRNCWCSDKLNMMELSGGKTAFAGHKNTLLEKSAVKF